MARLVEVPHIGMDLSEVTIVEWLVGEGATVAKGDPILTIETDKTNHDLEAEAAGVLRNRRGDEGDVIAVGAPLAWIVADGEQAPDLPADDEDGEPEADSGNGGDVASAPRSSAKAMSEPSPPPEPSAPTKAGPAPSVDRETVPAGSGATRGLASPAARRDAAARGVDIRQLAGSGPHGTVYQADVAASARPPAETGTGERIALSRIQQITGERTQASFRDVPHFYLERELAVGALQELRSDLRERLETKPSLGALLCFAIARTLAAHPRLNARLRDDKTIEVYPAIHLGIAVATDRGLLVPVIRDAGQLRLPTFLERYSDLTQRAVAGELTSAELAGGTFSVSNLGMFGVDRFSAIINPPQSGILALGRLRTVPQWAKDQWQPVSTLSATLSVDHRVADGADGGRFLADLAKRLSDWRLFL